MKSHNSYVRYKQDTRRLLYWMIRASNVVIKSLKTSGDDAALDLNVTGEVPVSSLVPMSELIAKHLGTVPSTIYRLFQSVIQLRSAHYAQFQQLASLNPDADIEKSNASHKFFIDTLTRAFEALGGEAWLNKFSALNVGDDAQNEEDGEGSSDEESDQDSKPSAAPQRRRQKRAPKGKGKKGKGKKPKQKRKPATTKEQTIDDVPLESYRIIEDDTGIVTEYLMAVYALAKEWIDLRAYLQGVWREVAYDGLNGAVAGTLSNVAVGMIKRSEATIFVDFPGHDSYDTVMKTITRGDPNKIQGNFQISLYSVAAGSASKLQQTALDVKEQFLIHAHQDLVDFATDFQQTRSGKPTKRMLAEIGNWDPNFDLQKASEKERLKWRRSYTINWLYDLVNVFSSIVVQRNTMKGEGHLYERVDWSPRGPWHFHRRLYGLNEFAGEVTTLAMQKPGTDIRQKIQPHLVFQLQCIVDALTVSRGWFISGLKGHVLSKPAPGFRPRRDVDQFLDREFKRTGTGYMQGTYVLKQLFQTSETQSGNIEFHKATFGVLEMGAEDFRDWLGESKYMYGLTTIPPSRFSNTNSNGLWEYSPFLCGIGLMEGLELAYRFVMAAWERMREPILILHLHNMLVQRGYLSRPVGLYATLEELFRNAFFGKEVPTKDFVAALSRRVEETGSRYSEKKRKADMRAASQAADFHGMLDLNAHRFFNQKSNLLLYREANWDPDGIPESDIDPISFLGMLRLSQTKHILDPITGDWRLEDTDLVRRTRAAGLSEVELLGMTWKLKMLREGGSVMTPEMANRVSQGYSVSTLNELNKASGGKDSDDVSGSTLLGLLKTDILSDIAGAKPISSLNYVWVTALMMMIFLDFEGRLEGCRNPSYLAVYGEGSVHPDKRLGLALQALEGENEELLKVMAEVFEFHRTGFMNHIYWEDLDLDFAESKKAAAKEPSLEDADANCCVM